tara:strand:- start:167 stop:667 length:501 start_codon:yes stop_codon:yes gene_type:complete
MENPARIDPNCNCITCKEETTSQKYRRLHPDRVTISQWKYRGLKLREGETYEEIYQKVSTATHCELCNVSFENKKPCMDHDHITGYFRKVLCNRCNASYMKQPRKDSKNNTTGHRLITYRESTKKYIVCKRINGKIIGERQFKNKIDAICYKYILLLKIKSNNITY